MRARKVAKLFNEVRNNLKIFVDQIDDLLEADHTTPYDAYSDEQIHILEMLAGPYGNTIMQAIRVKQKHGLHDLTFTAKEKLHE